jgi:hypothetical protein
VRTHCSSSAHQGPALAGLYALAVVVRYLVTRSHPIPIVFHRALAAFLFSLGRFVGRSDQRLTGSARTG